MNENQRKKLGHSDITRMMGEWGTGISEVVDIVDGTWSIRRALQARQDSLNYGADEHTFEQWIAEYNDLLRLCRKAYKFEQQWEALKAEVE